MITRAMRCALCLVAALAASSTWANNLTLTNLLLKPRDASTVFVQFDIRWENSWRHTNINHDAAWVFFKVKPEGRDAWEHAVLETNGYATGTGTPVEIVVPSDRVGCIIRRAGEGSGTLSVTNLRLIWNFASNQLVKTDRVRLQALALEMVYVAEGAFYLGSGGTEPGHFYQYTVPGESSQMYRVESETNAITVGTNAGNLCYDKLGGYAGDCLGVVSNLFPKGYAAFYCMKYEMSQAQYRDFLNTLTRAQQNGRTGKQFADWFALSSSATLAGRNGIRCPPSVALAPAMIVFGCDANGNKVMNEFNDGMDRACNYLCWADGAAFADWSGLRPMTELEFEKACRGPLVPQADEYIWGGYEYAATTGFRNDGTGQEAVSNGNCNIETTAGIFRVGIYATSNSTRQEAGATYWGILDMAGNNYERPVTVGWPTGRVFTGLHGNGQLNTAGNADVSGWPGTDASGAGFRGGTYDGVREYVFTSDRHAAGSSAGDGRVSSFGWRGVRTAP